MQTKKTIIGIAGEIASGKGTMAKYLEERHDAVIYRFSTYLRLMLNILNLEVDRKNMVTLSGLLRQGFGEEILSKAIFNDIESDPAKIIVVDGIRRVDDLANLKNLDGFVMAYITSDETIRYQRLLSRGENNDDQTKTLDEFTSDSQAETEKTIAPLMKISDFIIDNSASVEEFKNKIDELINKLK